MEGDTHRMRLALASKRNFGIGRKLTEAYTTQCNTNKADEKLLLGDNTFFKKNPGELDINETNI